MGNEWKALIAITLVALAIYGWDFWRNGRNDHRDGL